jgi:hypothetical protein
MLKILVYIYNQAVQYHGHKYIKLGTRRGKEWEPEMGHGWVIGEWRWKWKHRSGHKKRGTGSSRGGEGRGKVFSKVPHPKQGLQRQF